MTLQEMRKKSSKARQEQIDEMLAENKKSDQETYTWGQINQALMNKGYSPARIANILIELTHVTKK